MAKKKVQLKKKKKTSNFKMFLLIYSAILIVIGAVVVFMLHSFLVDYEESIPSNTMDDITEQFTVDNIGTLLESNDLNTSEFESASVIADYMKSKIDGNDVTYKKKPGEYTDEEPVYVVYAGDTPIAKVTLEVAGKNGHKFNKWECKNISFGDYSSNKSSNKITVPSGSVVKVNGVTVGDGYITERDVKFSPCLHVESYTTVPTETVYTLPDLIAEPKIEVTYNGNAVSVEETKDTYIAYYPMDTAMYEAQKDRITTIAEQYGKYIINRGSLSTLSSYMVGYAADYVSNIPAIWAYLYGKSYTYEFKNEKITNFRTYSSSCFSCDVYYDLYVNYGSGDTTYQTSMTYTFVLKNGTWMLADFILN